MSFNNTYRQVVEKTSPSHAWIALHRLVEAYARSCGTRFSVVFDELERELGFRRTVRTAWPSLATMQSAARRLRARRDELLARRDVLVAARRAAKAQGKRMQVPTELRNLQGGPLVPRVGFWGWRKRRERLGGT